MTQAAKIRDWPDWPRRMTAPIAASYLCISKTKFYRGVANGTYPQPIEDGGNTLWDRKRLDEFVDAQSGIGEGEAW